MRLVFVHGRGQGGRTADELLQTWTTALNEGLTAIGRPGLGPQTEVRLPFYGRHLDELSRRRPEPGTVGLRGSAPGTVDELEGRLVLEIADRAGISEKEIAAEAGQDVVSRDPQNWAWVQAAARVLSRQLPWLGRRLLPVLTEDVNAYLTRVHVTRVVDDLVAEAVGDGPAVVVAHSLGTVVAYRVLSRVIPSVPVPLLVTLGSPLGIDVVKTHLPTPLGRPPGVEHWLNAADQRDYVALYSRLDRDTFPAEIENLSDVHNPRDDPHGITGYLRDEVVAGRIERALNQPAATS